MIKFIPLIPLLGLAFFTACQPKEEILGSGNITSEEREIKNFTSISFSGNGNLFIIQSDHDSIRVEGEDNIIPYLKTVVSDGHLQIHFDNHSIKNFRTTKPLNVTVRVKNIHEVHLSGSGTITSQALEVDALKVSISGSGNADIHVKGQKLASILSGSGSFHVQGSVDVQDVWISGTGVYKAFPLESQTANIKISGAGNVFVNVRNNMDVRISGSGSVTYMGDPKVNQTVTGAGIIEKKKTHP